MPHGDQLPLQMVVALSYEIDAAANLLRRSLGMIHEFRSVGLDADPLLACLAIGVEKVTKLTLGLAAVEDNGSWPDKNTMQNQYGHRVAVLDRRCREYMARNVDRASAAPYIHQLLSNLQSDARIGLVLTTLDRYGTVGRFYNLDALAEAPQADPPPRELWEHVERSVWKDNDAILARLGGPGFDQARQEINTQIAASVEAWWDLYFRAWSNGVFGAHARQWSAQLSPR